MALFGKKKTEEKKEKQVPLKAGAGKSIVAKIAPSMKELYENKATAGAAAPAKAKEGERKGSQAGWAFKALVKPLISEKASVLGGENKYVFAVARDTNKVEIAKAIEEVYGVKPLKVNIIKVLGKKVRYGRMSGRRKNWKKAVITLPKGESIKVYEGV